MNGVGLSHIALVRGRVHKPARFIVNGFRCKCQNVVRSLDGLRQKHDAESRSFPRLATGEPLRQDQFLVGVVDSEFVADAVCGVGINRLSAAVDLERQVERSASDREPEKAVGLHLALSSHEREFVFADKLLDCHASRVTSPHRLDDDLGEAKRVLEKRRTDLAEKCTGRLLCIDPVQTLEAERCQLVIVLQAPAGVSG